MKVLVTGGAGFIGSHTIGMLLQQGHQVTSIDVKPVESRKYFDKAIYFKGDVNDYVMVSRIFSAGQFDAIIHLAAQVSVQNSIEDPITDLRHNTAGTLNILEACKKHNVKKLVFASSAAVYGEQTEFPIKEEAPKRPMSPYAISKLSSENYIEMYKELFGLKATIFRFSNVYGLYQNNEYGGVISKFLSSKEEMNVFNKGKQTRDFIHVSQIASALVNEISEDSSIVANLSTNTETSILDLACTISSFTQARVHVLKEALPGDIEKSVLDNRRLKICRPDLNLKQQLEYRLEEMIELEDIPLCQIYTKTNE